MTDSNVYLDYQASAPIDPAALEAMNRAYATPGNASSEEHSFGWAAKARVDAARAQVAALVNADVEEVFFTSGASEANNIAILGAARRAPASRRRVLISAFEHKSVSGPCEALAYEGFHTDKVPVGADGLVDLGALRAMIGPDVAVVSVMAVNNEIGTIQPIAEVAALGREAGAFVHVDATQALAAGPVDIRCWGADSLALSGHKICGPTGVGALVLCEDAPWRPGAVTFGGGQEGSLRPGTIAAPLCVGLGVACELLARIGPQERLRIAQVRSELQAALRARGLAFSITAEGSPVHPGCLHVRLTDVDALDLLNRLQPYVAASTGSACMSGVIGPSQVLLAIGMTVEQASECVRFSVGRFTSSNEVDRAADWIAAAVKSQQGGRLQIASA